MTLKVIYEITDIVFVCSHFVTFRPYNASGLLTMDNDDDDFQRWAAFESCSIDVTSRL